MTSSTSGPSLAHRNVSSIRSGVGQISSASGPTGGPASPHTPVRGVSSAFGSPSSLRAEEENIVVELGSRFIRVGFAGDRGPKSCLSSGPVQQRRTGDFSAWLPRPDTGKPWSSGADWDRTHELWSADVRSSDLGLVEDKIDRALREIFSKYLLVDSRQRRITLVLPPALPLPVLSTILDTLFNRFPTPAVSLVSSPTMAAVGAGVRSALVVNLGWAETVVTSVYEYREIRTTRSVRGTKMLVREVHDLLAGAKAGRGSGKRATTGQEPAQELSFDECEEIACRLTWCRQSQDASDVEKGVGLSTVQEQDESLLDIKDDADFPEPSSSFSLTLSSCGQPEKVEIPFQRFSEPCENTFIATQYSQGSFDDEETPVPQLIYQHLLTLPIDARAVCMSRVIFTGGGANIPGLRQRLFDEVSRLVYNRGWDPVSGKGAEQVKNRAMSGKRGTRSASGGPVVVTQQPQGQDPDEVWHDAANANPEQDPIEQMLNRDGEEQQGVQGKMRALESLGPWSGASMTIQLKTMAVASIDRELWLQQGAQGASRPGDVDLKAQQRQSLGPGLMRGASGSASTNWTLGQWGAAQ